jgi:hypothetical protein
MDRLNRPKTLDEARKYRYGQWAGNEKGHAFDPGCCAYELYRGWLPSQCSRKPGTGPGGIFCAQHAKKAGPS